MEMLTLLRSANPPLQIPLGSGDLGATFSLVSFRVSLRVSLRVSFRVSFRVLFRVSFRNSFRVSLKL